MNHSVSSIINVMTKFKYPIYSNDTFNYNLNIVGVRNSNVSANTFNDILYVFYRYGGKWIIHDYVVTLDPGTIYRKKPVNVNGTAAIMPGYYKGMWKVGKHKGKYPALVQANPCTVVRDNNKDAILDLIIPPFVAKSEFKEKGITTVKYYNAQGETVFTTETGMFGINCHKSGKGITNIVDYYSAGCVVFSDNTVFELEFMNMCNIAASIYGNSFSFCLINDSDFNLV